MKTSKQSKKKKLRILLSVLILLAPTSFYFYSALIKPLPYASFSPTIDTVNSGQEVKLDWPDNGDGAIGTLEDGLLDKSYQNEKPRPTASMAKVFTAYAVMQKKPFDINGKGALIKLDQTDVDFYNQYIAKGGSNTKVELNQQIYQKEALESLLLASSNNMADTLAFWAFGSLDKYKTYANEMIKKMGITNTTIDDASGFSASTVSTPADMIKFASVFMRNEVLKSIVAEQQATIPVAGLIRNTNDLLGYNGVIGIKTGHTNEAGGCLLFASEHIIDSDHKVTIIGVVQGALNSIDSFDAASSLLNSAKDSIGERLILSKDKPIGKAVSKWGAKVDLFPNNDLVYYGWLGKDFDINIEYKFKDINTKNFGTISTKQTSLKTDIIAKDNLQKPSMFWRLLHPNFDL